MTKTDSTGRSMIEMLGVLAIIGVLSAGGISGYSRAMEKYRLNRALEEISFMVDELLHYTKDFHDGSGQNLISVAEALNLIPGSWTNHQAYLRDNMRNVIYLRSCTDLSCSWTFYYNFQNNGSYERRLCSELVMNMAIPQQELLYRLIFRKPGNADISYYGNNIDKCAAGGICVRNLTAAEISAGCRSCLEGGDCFLMFTYTEN